MLEAPGSQLGAFWHRLNMIYLFLILLIGVHLSPLFLPMTDMWHAQGTFTQVLILIMFATTFIQKPSQSVRNIPFALLVLWVGGISALACFSHQFKNQINMTVLLGLFNFVCISIFYFITSSYSTKKTVNLVLRALKYIVILEIFVGIIQMFGISQFFAPIRVSAAEHQWSNVVGLVGNGTHLSNFLGITACLFFAPSLFNYLSLALIALFMLFTGTTIGDFSVSGYVILYVCALFYSWHKNKYVFLGLLSLPLILLVTPLPLKVFAPNGRYEIWVYYLNMFRQTNLEVTGVGLGTVNAIFKGTAFPKANHIHNEYIEYLFEVGIVGLLIILNMIVEFVKVKITSEDSLLLKTMVVGFLISCFFNFTSHLWMPSILALFAYGSFLALERGKNADSN